MARKLLFSCTSLVFLINKTSEYEYILRSRSVVKYEKLICDFFPRQLQTHLFQHRTRSFLLLPLRRRTYCSSADDKNDLSVVFHLLENLFISMEWKMPFAHCKKSDKSTKEMSNGDELRALDYFKLYF